ncbi:hypothetical protein EPN90_04460 [Patescibacteria group bacterium]|nr:MAG: hypothetical protein EPN90_04460 [Patescibacteria group bacterium]
MWWFIAALFASMGALTAIALWRRRRTQKSELRRASVDDLLARVKQKDVEIRETRRDPGTYPVWPGYLGEDDDDEPDGIIH